MAPAWFTVAIPVIIEPKTNIINVNGGIKINITFSQNFLSILPSYGTEGALLGDTNASTKIKSMYIPTSKIPGRKAPKNISPALVEVTSNIEGIDIWPVASLYKALRIVPAWSDAVASWSAKIIRTIEGGIICPKVPDAAIVPVARGAEYLFRSIAGKDINPIATTVAPTIPVVAANNAPTNTTEIPSPPLTGPKSWAIVTRRSSAILDLWSIRPMKINKGIAIRVSLSTSQYTPLRLVTPADNHSDGPPEKK